MSFKQGPLPTALGYDSTRQGLSLKDA